MNKLLTILFGLILMLHFAVPCEAQYHQRSNHQRGQYQRSNQQRSHRVVRRPVYRSQQTYRGQHPQTTYRSQHGTHAGRAISSSPQTNSDSYRLDSQDIVSLIVHGVLGDYTSAPVHWPKNGNDILPSIGYPMPVRDDGTLDLPLIDPVSVRGLTVLQAEGAIEQAYLKAEVLTGKNLVTCNLMRKRTVQVKVVHDQYPRSLPGSRGQAITKVNIPADNATPLRALAEAGGYFDSSNIQVLRRSPSFDGGLSEGDIVEAPLPEPAFYYAGGLLNNGRYEIPAGVNINAIQAIAQTGGSVLGRSGVGPSELVLTRGSQTRRYNVNWLTNNPNALQIRPGDTITIRNTPGDILGNTAIDLLRFGILRGL